MVGTPLTALLARYMGEPPPGEAEAVEHRLRETFDEASRRWPKVSLGRDLYLKRLAELCLAASPAPYSALAELQLTDLYLATACAAADPSAAVCFDQEYLSRVPAYLGHLRLSPAQVEDLCMLLRERLLLGPAEKDRRIATYKGQAPLGKWLRVTAVRAALDHRRNKNEQAVELDAESGIAQAIAKDNNPEIDYLLGRYQVEFKLAVREAFAELPERDRTILQMYYLGGLNTPQIAKLHGVVNTTASRWVADARERVAAAVQARLQERLKIAYSELQSIFRALRSRIDWSLSAALKGT